jgi:hypothetical protein
MSDKFNLKWYQETDGDAHIDQRLDDDHTGENIDEISEAQLERDRTGDPDLTLEGLLNKNRPDLDFRITEAALDENNGEFGSDFRNPEAYEGDINKLEEKRLLNNPVEDEPYEPLTETPKKLRWWEGKSPDGLKVAKKNK